LNICSSPPESLEIGRSGWAKSRGRTAIAGAGADGAADLPAGRLTACDFFDSAALGRGAGWLPALAGALGVGSLCCWFALIACASVLLGFMFAFGTGYTFATAPRCEYVKRLP
jgi:hypothetical protein